MKFLAMALLLTSTVWAHPDLETKMATITSNIDNDTGRFFLITDDNGDIDAIRHTITKRNGDIKDDMTHTWERVRDGGVVLVEREGREVLRLYIDQKFSPQTGGIIRINYLYSGVSGARRDLNLQLVRDGNNFLLKKDANLVNTLMIHGNWHVLLGLIGIANITHSYTAPLMPVTDDYTSSFE